jgi:hypothetical protein
VGVRRRWTAVHGRRRRPAKDEILAARKQVDEAGVRKVFAALATAEAR